jgi:calcium-dependent protein kinase
MSPQLLQKQKYTNKSDLWSVGLILYEMLHGKTPWMASNELQLIKAIHAQKVTFSKLISEGAVDFISKCLEISEERRMSWEEAFEHPLVRENQEEDKTAVSKSRSSRCLKVVL